jgi:Ca-activated chloride channel family protein
MRTLPRFRARLRPLALIALLAALAVPAAAKSAEDYLHGGASLYIQGRLQEAGVEVEEGLRRFPNDPRLKTLAGQLKKMKDQQKQDQSAGSSQGGDENKNKQDKKDSAQGQGKEGKQDKDKDKDKGKDQEKEKPDQGQEKDKGQGQDQKPQPEDGKQGDSSGQAAAPAKPGQMSKEDAERLLNSYQDDEKREQKQMRQHQRRPVEVEEDW